MTDDMTVQLPGGEHVVRRDGGSLRIGRRTGDDVSWLEDVDVSLLPAQAQEALERGDATDAALQLALASIATADDERGG